VRAIAVKVDRWFTLFYNENNIRDPIAEETPDA